MRDKLNIEEIHSKVFNVDCVIGQKARGQPIFAKKSWCMQLISALPTYLKTQPVSRSETVLTMPTLLSTCANIRESISWALLEIRSANRVKNGWLVLFACMPFTFNCLYVPRWAFLATQRPLLILTTASEWFGCILGVSLSTVTAVNIEETRFRVYI